MDKITKTLLIISIVLIIISVCMDLIPIMNLDTPIKLIIYIFAMIIAFIDMKINLKNVNDDKLKEKIRKNGLILILIIYSVLLITLLLIDGNYRRNGMIGDNNIPLFSATHFELYSNFVPFRIISNYIRRFFEGTINTSIVLTNILGNIIAFAPYGILIPLISKEKFNNIINFSLLMISIILCVEIIQFLTFNGTFDIDDLILNLLGAIIMFYFIKLKVIKKLLDNIIN